MTALRQRLLEVFEVEYREHLEVIRKILAEGNATRGALSERDLAEATRCAHSLKGAARAVGLEDVESVAHSLEALFIKVERREAVLDKDLRGHILDSLDEIEDQVVASRSTPIARPAVSAPAPASGAKGRRSEAEASTPASVADLAPGAATSVRLEASNLDDLLKSATELHADMMLQQAGAQDMRDMAGEAASLVTHWARFWQSLSAPQRDGRLASPLRATGPSDQIGPRLKELGKQLARAAQAQEKRARSLRRHLDDLEGRVKAARMIPAENLFGGFRKMVRDIAGSESKQVEVVINGLECEADRLVLQRFKDPLMHMLRNAVSHGIEPPHQRLAQGKPAAGRVVLSVSSERDRLSVVVEDDGRGLDFARIAERAVANGLLSHAEADAASESALSELIYEPGFSTAESVTKISGRGMGLSVAREAVIALQGRLAVHSAAGRGTRIEASLPVSILSRRLLLVAFDGHTYALPSDAVVRLIRINVSDVTRIEGRHAILIKGETLFVVSLDRVLKSGKGSVTTDRERAFAVVLRTGSGHVAVLVDGFVGVNDFIVRSLPLGRRQRTWSGVVSTDDGTPCLVLNAGAFSVGDETEIGTQIVFKAARKRADAAKRVLVVDDSITTRTLEKSILEAHGYKVRLSVDGRDALAQLRTEPADIVVSDIEMPHLNGFELVRAMKADAALGKIPVILVTSRDDPRDRKMGLDLGADAYVVKQKFDQDDLLRTIEQMT